MTALNGSMLSVAEVSAICGLSEKSVYRAIDRSELAATKLGAQWRIHRSDFQRWIDAGANSKREPVPTHGPRKQSQPGGLLERLRLREEA